MSPTYAAERADLVGQTTEGAPDLGVGELDPPVAVAAARTMLDLTTLSSATAVSSSAGSKSVSRVPQVFRRWQRAGAWAPRPTAPAPARG
jgi:hypothetical protein